MYNKINPKTIICLGKIRNYVNFSIALSTVVLSVASLGANIAHLLIYESRLRLAQLAIVTIIQPHSKVMF